jgi:hypothetical protein
MQRNFAKRSIPFPPLVDPEVERVVHKDVDQQRDSSAGHVENGICSFGFLGKRLDSLVRGQNQQFDFSASRLEFHFVHHRKRSISSRADYEAFALPGYLFRNRDRGMSELLAEFFRGLFLALANPAAVNDDVTFIGNAINLDSTEVKFAEVHGGVPRFTLILSARTRRGSEVRGCRARGLCRSSAPRRFSSLAGPATAILFDHVGTGRDLSSVDH